MSRSGTPMGRSRICGSMQILPACAGRIVSAAPPYCFRSAEVFMHLSGAWTELMPSQLTLRVVPSTE